MADFLNNYGLFFAKVFTIVIAIIIVLIAMASLALKNKGGSDGTIVITNLNDEFESTQKALKQEMLSKAEFKNWQKKEKKKKKQQEKSEHPASKLFVIDFEGDIKASDTDKLTECINALLECSNPEDEVLVILDSSGGFVHSYGLASSQLHRIRENNLHLTVAIDKCAASGGYMMACVANHIIAAPFAIIGSIGVVGQLPNFNKVLKKNDIDYEMHTAGEYKRTLTILGENTDKQRQKFIDEIQITHDLFKDHVSSHRPQLNMAEVATGEHWHAIQAYEKKLVDKLQTSDDFILEKIKSRQVYELDFQKKQSISEKLSSKISMAVENTLLKLMVQTGLFKY